MTKDNEGGVRVERTVRPLHKFEEWFEAQFGKRQHPEAPDDDELRRRISSADAARKELDARIIWDAQYQAGAYAKNAAPTFDF